MIRLFLVMMAMVMAVPFVGVAAPRKSLQDVRVTFSSAVKKAEPSVVNIFAARVNRSVPRTGIQNMPGMDGQMQDRIARSLGSGVIVRRSGVVVTNLHVIDGAQAIKVVLSDGREFAAKKIGQDEKLDLAVLQIQRNNNESLPAAKFGNSDSLAVGDVVLAIGNPYGIGQSVSFGIVSAVERSAMALSPYARFIQTDASINPGNSGGALVDSTGALVGINAGIFSKSGASNGIGFAIPASLVERVVNDITTKGTVVRPWFGAEGQMVTEATAREMGLQPARGVEITAVVAGSPAMRAGLQAGDVLLALDGNPIENPGDLNEQILAMPNLLNKEAKLVFWRGGKRIDTTVTLTALPERKTGSQLLIKGYNPLNGVKVEELGPALAADLKLPLGTKGVIAVDVPGNPPLEAFGMPVMYGDLIMAINGSTIRQVEDVQRALESSRSEWSFRLLRGGKVVNIQTR